MVTAGGFPRSGGVRRGVSIIPNATSRNDDGEKTILGHKGRWAGSDLVKDSAGPARHGRVCYVSNAGSDDVSAVDLSARKEVARIKVGRMPKRLLTAVVPKRGGTGHDSSGR